MNIAAIFAGGVGSRMNSRNAKPKQFLEMHGKPIIVHTLEIFQQHLQIDAITVSCIAEWIPYLEKLVNEYHLTKVKAITHGGETGQQSIYNALLEAEKLSCSDEDIVLIHDGVRPLITSKTIDDNITSVKEFGSAITSVKVKETVLVVSNENEITSVPKREDTRLARAPQSFFLKDILNVHRKAMDDGYRDFIDSCTMMQHYGEKLYLVEGPFENIKITTPEDFYTMRALLDAKENAQIYGDGE